MRVKLVKWIRSNPPWIKTIIFTIVTILPVYFSAFLSIYLASILENKSIPSFITHSVFIFILSGFFLAIYVSIRSTYEQIDANISLRKEVLSYAFSQIQRFITTKQEAIFSEPKRITDYDEVSKQALKNIKILIERLYQLFESKYGESDELENRITFEATFMTKSYIDNKITIPASSNRDNRTPISMNKRSQNNSIYDETVTGEVYKEFRPKIRIVESTDINESMYKSLYQNQKERIKSSIVFPVLSPSNELLGTIVVHCDRIKFFLRDDQKYWTELLEIFSKNVGIEKIKLDFINKKWENKLF